MKTLTDTVNATAEKVATMETLMASLSATLKPKAETTEEVVKEEEPKDTENSKAEEEKPEEEKVEDGTTAEGVEERLEKLEELVDALGKRLATLEGEGEEAPKEEKPEETEALRKACEKLKAVLGNSVLMQAIEAGANVAPARGNAQAEPTNARANFASKTLAEQAEILKKNWEARGKFVD